VRDHRGDRFCRDLAGPERAGASRASQRCWRALGPHWRCIVHWISTIRGVVCKIVEHLLCPLTASGRREFESDSVSVSAAILSSAVEITFAVENQTAILWRTPILLSRY
jgi:hypothetical protein